MIGSGHAAELSSRSRGKAGVTPNSFSKKSKSVMNWRYCHASYKPCRQQTEFRPVGPLSVHLYLALLTSTTRLIMGSCGASVNCTDVFTPITRTVLPDIVGIGVCENRGQSDHSRL
jgi:hypothetical protein